MRLLFFLSLLVWPLCYLQASNVGDYSVAKQPTDKNVKMAQDAAGRKQEGTEAAWMAVPIPFANPTIGAGLQAAVLYMHEKKEADVPNTTSGIGGMYADSKSYFIGAFHDDYWASDRFRGTFMLGHGKLNLNYYGSGQDSVFQDNPVGYTITANAIYAKLLMRIEGTDHWFGGVRYVGSEATVGFDVGQLISGLPFIEEDIRTSGLGVVFTYDDKDDNYYPADGQNFQITYTVDNETIGSDFNFERLDTYYKHYLEFVPKHVLAFKAELKNSGGDAPFFMEPTLSMRGFDTSKYRDKSTLSLHAEWRWTFVPRWGVVAFAEGGVTGSSLGNLPDGRSVTSVGGGLRWQATKAKKINLGLDIAFSENDKAFYIRAAEAY